MAAWREIFLPMALFGEPEDLLALTNRHETAWMARCLKTAA